MPVAGNCIKFDWNRVVVVRTVPLIVVLVVTVRITEMKAVPRANVLGTTTEICVGLR